MNSSSSTDSSDAAARKPGRFANRSRARIVAFQILFQEDLNPGFHRDFAETYLSEELPNHVPLLEFARSLIERQREHREEIDAILDALAHHWSLRRMSATDRNILRLAVCEMKYVKTPKAVVISEAIRLAQQFGSGDSVAFVNGILDKIEIPQD